MPDIAISSKASPDSIDAQFATNFGGYTLGEDVNAGVPLCLDTATGKLWRFNSPSAAAANRVIFVGLAPRKGLAGQPCTPLGIGAVFHISDGALLNPGLAYFVSDTVGAISDASVAGVDTQGAFIAVSKTDLQIVRLGKLA